MLSADNFKQGSTSTTGRRVSAPPISRPAVFSPPSATQAEPPQLRPRSNSQVQIPLYSPTTFARPLPALPISAANTKGSYGRDVNTIKAPVKEGTDVNVDGEVGSLQTSLPSPHIFNSNRLHPSNHGYGYGYGYSNSLHPHSPQLIPKDFPYSSQVQQQQGQQPSSTGWSHSMAMPDSRSLDYQSSVSSNNSSNTHPNANQPPVDLHNDVYRPRRNLDVPGREGSSEDMHQSLYQKTASGSTGAFRTSWVEPPQQQQQHHPANHLSMNNTAIPLKQQPSPACLSSFTSCPAESSSVTGLQPNSRLHNLDTSPSSPRSTVEYNTGDMSSLTSSSSIHPEYPVHLPSDLQPYCPPPPSFGNARSLVPPWQQGQSEGNPIPSTFTSRTPVSAPLPLPASVATPSFIPLPPRINAMAGSKTTTLAPNHSGRRHSSGAQELFIKTKHLHTINPGPSTADVSSSTTTSTRTTASRGRYLDPEVSTKGSSRNTSRTRQPSPSRPSPSRLDIPRHQQQIQSQQQPQQQTHYAHHSKHYQHPVSPQNKVSTLRSPSSSRTGSPSSSGLLDSFQDRTAMALMQRYLMRPDDPDSEADIAMQIMISQAAVDSKGFEILVPQTVERIKRHYATLSSRITALTARLSLESKIREAAQSLLRLHADNKKLARQANDHLEAANRKVDQVATELWKLTQLAADFQRTLLQHTSGVLALGVVRLEDQGRRERDMHAKQLQEARIGRDVEEQFESMAKAIISLESDALEAQSLLEDKDRAIERLVKQLEHQRDLFIKLDDQQQKAMALSRSRQANLEKVDDNSDAKAAAELRSFLGTVQQRLQSILQKQQEQYRQRTKDTSSDGYNAREGSIGDTGSEQGRFRSEKGWSSESTLISKTAGSERIQDDSMTPAREDSVSSGPSGTTTTLSETLVGSKPSTPPGSASTNVGQISYFSMDGIRSVLDELESRVTESHQKMHVLEGEIGLLRRQSLVLSASRNNSIKIKNFSAPASREAGGGGGQADERIRSALEKSLKDALLAKEMAQQELENERQRWQEDQNHRISALEESLVAAEDKDKALANIPDLESSGGSSKNEVVQELRRQLQDAIEEIDVLNHQHQSNLQSMRQLFDLLPDVRRRSHMDLLASHQQLQQQIATSPAGSAIPHISTSGRASPSDGVSSLVSTGIVGFSMEALIDRVKELVARSEQVERNNDRLRHSTDGLDMQSGQVSRTASPSLTEASPKVGEGVPSTKILKSEFERLQANADKIPLLENELDLLKQHADVLMEENARLAELAAASATSTPVPARSTILGTVAKERTRDDSLDELQEIIRLKDRLLRERDQLVQEQEMALQQAKIDLTNALASSGSGVETDGESPADSNQALSQFDVNVMEDLRHKYSKLEEQAGEMRMVIAALESMSGGPGSGSQLLKSLSISSNSPSPGTSSWLSSSLGVVGSLSFGSLVQNHPARSTPGTVVSPGSSAEEAFSSGASDSTDGAYSSDNAATLNTGNNRAIVAGATAALRKEFRRAMGDLREEKERAVRKEVEERRRLERELRQMRRELQAIQIS